MEVLVQDAIAKVCEIDRQALQPDAKLTDLGVDSLAAAEGLVELEIQLGREFPIDVLRRLDGAETVADIAARLGSVSGSGQSPA